MRSCGWWEGGQPRLPTWDFHLISCLDLGLGGQHANDAGQNLQAVLQQVLGTWECGPVSGLVDGTDGACNNLRVHMSR